MRSNIRWTPSAGSRPDSTVTSGPSAALARARARAVRGVPVPGFVDASRPVCVLEEPGERLVGWQGRVAEELRAEHLDPGARGADADLAARRGQRLEQPRRVGRAGRTCDPEEHV